MLESLYEVLPNTKKYAHIYTYRDTNTATNGSKVLQSLTYCGPGGRAMCYVTYLSAQTIIYS